MNIRLYGTVPDSIVDGPGLRYAVFLQGCSHTCPGCHNPESQPFDAGTETTVEAVFEDITTNALVENVTLTGGDPFDQAEAAAELAARLKAAHYGVWTYTGYLYEDLLEHGTPAQRRLLEHTDVLVDGPFVESLKSYALDWRGSSNQRLIDLAAMRAADLGQDDAGSDSAGAPAIIEWKSDPFSWDDLKPTNW